MKLVIDANILISILIRNQGTRALFFSNSFTLFAPEFLLEEIHKHEAEIMTKANISKQEFDFFLHLVASKIIFIPRLIFAKHIETASKISPDKNDVLYFALALKLQSSIWSNDKKLKNQKTVTVLSTTDLLSKTF